MGGARLRRRPAAARATRWCARRLHPSHPSRRGGTLTAPRGLLLRAVRRRFGARPPYATALDGVDIEIAPGEIVGLVGESGSGKTTLARIAAGLDRPDSGSVTLDGRRFPDGGGRAGRPMRAAVQMVFQDPLASFNPRRSVGGSIALADAIHSTGRRRDRLQRTAQLLNSVGLEPALGRRRPHDLSGGQLQRAAIARALATRPAYLICDEPVASLDVLIRAQVLDLLTALRGRSGLGVLFVSHDLGVVRRIADRTVVLYLGRVVEEGPTASVFARPQHPYTRALLAAVPSGLVPWRERAGAGRPLGDPPSPFAIPPGCRFHPRCPEALPLCRSIDPPLYEIDDQRGGQRAACVLVAPNPGRRLRREAAGNPADGKSVDGGPPE